MRSRCHLQLTQDPCAGCDSLVCCCLLLVQASLLCEMQQVADWQSEALLARQKARLNARAAWHYLDAAIQLMKQEMTFSRPFDGSNGAPPPTSHEAALGMLRIAVRHMPDSLQKVASALQSFRRLTRQRWRTRRGGLAGGKRRHARTAATPGVGR